MNVGNGFIPTSVPGLHSFHKLSTSRREEERSHTWKTSKGRVYPPNCSVSLLMSLFKSLSFLRCSSIFSTECKTVVWCLPPNCRPISGREASVRCLARYIAIWRGYTIARELFLSLISAKGSPHC